MQMWFIHRGIGETSIVEMQGIIEMKLLNPGTPEGRGQQGIGEGARARVTSCLSLCLDVGRLLNL